MHVYSISIQFNFDERSCGNCRELTIGQQIQYDEYPDDWQDAN